MKRHNILVNTALWDTSSIPMYQRYVKNTSHKVYRKLIALGYKPLGGNFSYNLGAKHYLINVIGEIIYEGISENMIKVRLTKRNRFKVVLT